MFTRTCSGVLYDVLELDSQCTAAEVTQHYRRLALRYHPDRNAGTTVEQFQQIEEAHRVLSDPQQRQLYDTVGRDGLKQLGDYGGGMVGSLLLAVGNVAAGCLLVGILSSAFFASLLIGCYKIDEPTRWPSWGVILLPVWLLSPVLVGASLTVMIESYKRGLYMLLLPSVRLLLCVVMAATAAAALDHRLTPACAFIPWIAWFVMGTLGDTVAMVPTVYRRTHAQPNPFAPAGSHNAPGAGGSGARSASANNRDDSGSCASSDNGSFVVTPWRTWQYWRELAELTLETVCVYLFISFALQRALQQQRNANADSVMSFWVILAPLIAFFGVHVAVHAWEGFFTPASGPHHCTRSSSSSSPLNAAPAFPEGDEEPTGASLRSSVASPSHPQPSSCGECVANTVVRTFPSMCCLYMSVMWAAKAEYEYNGRTHGADPSAFLAFLPILVVLGALALFICCGGCLVMCLGRSLANVNEEETAAAARQHHVHSPSQRTTNIPPNLARDKGYRSTTVCTPRAPGGAGSVAASPKAAPHQASRRGNGARDVAIEQID
ncbi:putative heat shock protein [Leptomonas seymouri]|uniref:Putative heat shock protein n=1 Tax=Leptomonas seymouri TaxID=5684 RepID=A0A0N0P2R3_LEPSE|nr:putative heat shock protein [Leptomonas seymouri]|eukprot:KPI82807.1 putative heat shock protein [Leptomonas seymouri]